MVDAIGKGEREHIQPIDDALSRLAKGHKVDIEAEADVVDHSDREAIQHKKVSGGEQQLGANIKSALKQLAGKSAKDEVPPPGYQRVADIRLEPTTKQYDATGPELQNELRKMKTLHDDVGKNADADSNATLEGLGPDLEIRITTNKGTFRFEGTNFDLIP